MQSKMIFCETVLSSGPEVMNTLSSIVYVILGLYVIFRSLKTSNKWNFIVMGILIVNLGVMSALLHFTQSQIGLILDLGSMLLLIVFVLSQFLLKTNTMTKVLSYLLYLLILALALLTLNSFIILVTLILTLFVGLYLFYLQDKDLVLSKYGKSAIILMVIAFVFWVIDYVWHCSIQGLLINGHAIWHLLTACAIYYIYKLCIIKS